MTRRGPSLARRLIAALTARKRPAPPAPVSLDVWDYDAGSWSTYDVESWSTYGLEYGGEWSGPSRGIERRDG